VERVPYGLPATGEMGGATAIATVSRSEQAELVKAAGADHIINYKTEDVVRELRNHWSRRRTGN